MQEVPILRSGVVAQHFCSLHRTATVEAVFARSLYLRSSNEFLCMGEPSIGNGPLTLIGDVGISDLALRPGQSADVNKQHLTIGDVRFTLDGSEIWRPAAWPPCPPRARLIETCRI